MQTQTDKYLQAAVRAAVNAGNGIMKYYSATDSVLEIEHKEDDSPLTAADKCADKIICDILTTTGLPIISEETKDEEFAVRRGWERLWIVDPLDGTKEFISRNGEFTVNIALIEGGSPVMGVIYIPVSGILYFGSKDEGAFRVELVTPSDDPDWFEIKNNAVVISAAKDVVPYTIVASRSHRDATTDNHIEEKKKQYGEVEVLSCGSSIKICRVAEGSANEYPRFGRTMEWDIAAGHAILKAAGGEIYSVEGCEPLTYNKENLANPPFIAVGSNYNKI